MLTAQGSNEHHWQQTQVAVNLQTTKSQVGTEHLDVAWVKQKHPRVHASANTGACDPPANYITCSFPPGWRDENVFSRGFCREYLRIAAAGCVLCRQSVRPDTDSVGASHPQPMRIVAFIMLSFAWSGTSMDRRADAYEALHIQGEPDIDGAAASADILS